VSDQAAAPDQDKKTKKQKGGEKVKLTGLRKAGIFLLSIEKELAGKILKEMDPDAVERISLEIARMDEVAQEERMMILEEFYRLFMANKYYLEGGLDYAKTLLQSSLDRDTADNIIKSLEQSIQQTPFAFLKKTENESLAAFIQDEHDQTIALILAHLQASQAAEILKNLPKIKKINVIKRIATMDQTNPEVIKEVEWGLKQRLAAMVSQSFEKTGGVQIVSEILNMVERNVQRDILENLEEEDTDLVEQIKRLMFVFEDILLVNDRGIQRVMGEVDKKDLSLALKTASEELKEKIFKNVSQRQRENIQEEMDFMGPVRLKEVEESQQRIVENVRKLADAGEIFIQGRGGEDEIVV